MDALNWECNKPKEDVVFQVSLASSSPWTGTLYGDASGGKYSSYQALRRVGCGLVMLTPDSVCKNSSKLLAAINCNLPGPVQTIPRGELYCILIAVTLAPENSTIDFVTDTEGNF